MMIPIQKEAWYYSLSLIPSYQIFNTLTHFPQSFYESSLIPHAFLAALFSDPNHISLHHWRSLLVTVMTPFTLHCPSRLYTKVLVATLPELSSYLNNQIVQAWARAGDILGYEVLPRSNKTNGTFGLTHILVQRFNSERST